MDPYLAYFLGLFTTILIIVIGYVFALLFGGFRTAVYEPILCDFPQPSNPNNPNDPNDPNIS